MRVIIAGGREVTDYSLVVGAIRASGFHITEVVSGGQTGVDTLGERWAAENGIPVHQVKAEWDRWEKQGNRNAAGPVRNREMARYANALIAIPTGGPGTGNMILQARKHGLKVYVYAVRG